MSSVLLSRRPSGQGDYLALGVSRLLTHLLAADAKRHIRLCCCVHAADYTSRAISCLDPQTMPEDQHNTQVARLWTTGLIRCLSLTVSLSQEGGSLVDSRGVLRLPLYTAWLELYQKEVTFDL